MTAISIVSLASDPETRADKESRNAVALLCSIGLLASFCLMMFGVDISVTST